MTFQNLPEILYGYTVYGTHTRIAAVSGNTFLRLERFFSRKTVNRMTVLTDLLEPSGTSIIIGTPVLTV
jgi:hypothetical protein